jgi:hypothetical protein
MQESKKMAQNEPDYWRRLEKIAYSWIVSSLESIASDLIKSDLVYATRHIDPSFLDGWRDKLRDFLTYLTQAAQDSGEIDFHGKGLSSQEVSGIIIIMITGLSDRSIVEVRESVAGIIKFLRATLQA